MAHGLTHYSSPGFPDINPYLSRTLDGGITQAYPPWWNSPFGTPGNNFHAVKTVVYTFNPGFNLVSFPFKFASGQNTPSFIIPPATYPGITDLITASAASTNNGSAWIGSISTIDAAKGYWVKNDSDTPIVITVRGASLYGANATDVTWASGNNLVSYPLSNSQTLDSAIKYTLTGDDINSWIGESEAAFWVDASDAYIGSLESFTPNKGYWVNVDSGLTSTTFWENPYPALMTGHPIGDNNNFWYYQSENQTFYFTPKGCFDKDGVELVPGDDWIATFRGDVCCGSSWYNGRHAATYTNITPDYTGFLYSFTASIGDTDSPYTDSSNFGQFVVGEEPSFVIYKMSENKYYRAKIIDDSTELEVDLSSYPIASNQTYYDANWKLKATTEIV